MDMLELENKILQLRMELNSRIRQAENFTSLEKLKRYWRYCPLLRFFPMVYTALLPGKKKIPAVSDYRPAGRYHRVPVWMRALYYIRKRTGTYSCPDVFYCNRNYLYCSFP